MDVKNSKLEVNNPVFKMETKLCVKCSEELTTHPSMTFGTFCHNPDCDRFGLITIAYQTS